MMKKYYPYLLIFLVSFVIAFLYNFFLLNVNCDEIWNYGFSYNMLHGLVPYRDFNVVVTPLFFMLGSLFVGIFGNHIWAYDIYIAVIVSILTCLCYFKMGKVGLLLFPIFVPHFGPSYNALCFLLCFIILLLLDTNVKNRDFLIGILVACVFLTKQSIGAVLFLVLFLCSIKRLKALCGFLIPNLLFLIYLIYSESFFGFIDYCFLGLLDFNESNLNFSIAYMPLFIISFVMIVISFVKSGFKNKKLFFILGFQSVAYPIFDANHVMLGILFYLAYLLDVYKEKLKKNFKYYLIISSAFLLSYCTLSYDNYHLYSDKDSILYGKGIYDSELQSTSNYDMVIKELKKVIINRIDNYDNVFVFSLYRTDFAYVCKLDLGIPIGKLDLINNGNMGYHGGDKSVNSISSICSNSKCLFVMDDNTLEFFGQANKKIYDFVVSNYKKIDEVKKDVLKISIYDNQEG